MDHCSQFFENSIHINNIGLKKNQTKSSRLYIAEGKIEMKIISISFGMSSTTSRFNLPPIVLSLFLARQEPGHLFLLLEFAFDFARIDNAEFLFRLIPQEHL